MPTDRFVFAHLADAHVGAWPRDPAVRAALRESVLRALRVVSERDAEFLLISGDLFHTPVPDPGEVAPVAAALRALVEQGRRVYAIYGSHDYVAHRTSWLDVLAEAGVFLKVAPEAVRTEGTRWTLPFRVDEPTGAGSRGSRAGPMASTGGTSGPSIRRRSAPNRVSRSSSFTRQSRNTCRPSFAPISGGSGGTTSPPDAITTPAGASTTRTEGEGPGGGQLVNPGAVFGTSRTDLVHGEAGRTHQGVAIVTVDHGTASVEFVDTAPRDTIRLIEIDVSGQSAEEAHRSVAAMVKEANDRPGTLVFPKIRGTLADGSVAALALTEVARNEGKSAGTVHWDVSDLELPEAAGAGTTTEAEVETDGDRPSPRGGGAVFRVARGRGR